MADATLPQTKYAQKLKAYDGELPSYIHAMDEYAARAGLTIRHLLDRCYIVLVYSGRREQIGRYGLSKDGEECIHWPRGTRISSELSLHKLSPARGEDCGRIFKINEERYAIQITEPLPRAISTVGEGIECFDFNDGTNLGYVAYVGEKDKLISEGIAEAGMFPDDSTEEGRLSDGKKNISPYASYILEKTTRLHGGRWAYIKCPQRIQETKAKELERRLSSYKTPEEYRQHLLKVLTLASTFVELSPVETKAGQIYSIDAESKEAIEDAWRELYWAIHDAVIHARPRLTLVVNQTARHDN